MKGALVDKRIALTGATGFIGSVLLPKLLIEGAHVVALTRKTEKAHLLRTDRIKWVEWDLEKPEVTGAIFQDVDAICHLAAYIPAALHDITEAEACILRNGLGTLGLLQAARANGVSFFLNVSTGQLYAPIERSVREQDPTYPSMRATPYLTSKLVGDIFVDHCGRSQSLRTINLRIGSAYGPGMSPRLVVSRFIQQALRKQPIKLIAAGMYSVDLVFVEDVVDVIIKALENKVTGVFNVGSGEKTTMYMLAREILRLTGGNQELIEFVPGESDPGFPALDIGMARNTFGYSPTPLSTGLSQMIEVLAVHRSADTGDLVSLSNELGHL